MQYHCKSHDSNGGTWPPWHSTLILDQSTTSHWHSTLPHWTLCRAGSRHIGHMSRFVGCLAWSLPSNMINSMEVSCQRPKGLNMLQKSRCLRTNTIVYNSSPACFYSYKQRSLLCAYFITSEGPNVSGPAEWRTTSQTFIIPSQVHSRQSKTLSGCHQALDNNRAPAGRGNLM